MVAPPQVTSDPAVQAGDVLAGRYQLVRLLGEGAMGTVWEARQVTTGKAVALKLLKGRDAADAVRFLREARLASGLSHRNIVQVFDYWEAEGGGPTFMVMELLEGETLAARLARVGRLSLDEALAVTLPIASALRAAHAQGVVHRDLKPENVFLSRSSSEDGAVDVKVVDFGLARPTAPDAAATAITQSGAVMGTPHHMAPEQVYGDKDIDGRTDVWALGTVIWECLAGEKTFGGDNFGQIFRRISHTDVQPLRDVASGTPPWLAALVSRMLSHDRDGRPSMAEVHGALLRRAYEPIADAAPIAPAPPPTLRLPPPSAAGNAATQLLPPAGTRLTAATSVRSTEPLARRAGRAGALRGIAALGVFAAAAAALWAYPRATRPSVSVDLGAMPSVLSAATPPPAPPSVAAMPDPFPMLEIAASAPPAPQPSPRHPRVLRPAPSAGPTVPSGVDPLSRGRF